MTIIAISLLGILICLILAWKLDRMFALKLAVLVLVILVIAGVAMTTGAEEPVRSWMVPAV